MDLCGVTSQMTVIFMVIDKKTYLDQITILSILTTVFNS